MKSDPAGRQSIKDPNRAMDAMIGQVLEGIEVDYAQGMAIFIFNRGIVIAEMDDDAVFRLYIDTPQLSS